MRPVGIERVLVGGLTNAEFLTTHAAAGRVGLIGGPSLIEKVIRRAQRRQRADGSWSEWGHAFLFQGKRPDGKHWVLESDIDVHRERAQIGVQENRIDKYFDDIAYPHVAVLDFGMSEPQAHVMIGEGLRLLAERTQYSLREVLAAYWKLKKPSEREGKNRLARERAMFCSAFVQHLFVQVGIDFANDVETKLTTPEDIIQTTVPHTAYWLERA